MGARETDLNATGNAKVDEFEIPLDTEEVGGLEVAVHNAVLVNASDSLKHLLDVQPQVVFVDARVLWCALCSVAVQVLQDAGEVNIAALHHHAKHHALFVHLRRHKLDDARLSLQLLQQVLFVQERLTRCLVLVAKVNLLQCADPALWVKNAVHKPRAALANAVKLHVRHATHKRLITTDTGSCSWCGPWPVGPLLLMMV